MLIQKSQSRPSAGGGPAKAGGSERAGVVKSEYSAQLDEFAKEVLKKMQDENIPPLPDYFTLYFEILLQEKPFEFRKMIAEQVTSHDTNTEERRAMLENQLKEGFASITELLKHVSSLYKTVMTSIEISKKRSQEAKGINNPAAVQNFAVALTADSENMANILSKYALIFKDLYSKSAAVVKNVESESIFDSKYGIYNKRYLFSQIQNEIKMIGKFGHSSTLIFASLSTQVVAKIGNDKGIVLVNKTMAKLFLKTSRRSDVVSYYGQGIFGLLLKHTDLNNAIRTSERLSELMRSTNFFLGDTEVELKINIGLASIDKDRGVEDIVECTLAAMRKCDLENDRAYILCDG